MSASKKTTTNKQKIKKNHRKCRITSGNLVPAGTQGLKEAEAINGDQSSRIENTQLFMLWWDLIIGEKENESTRMKSGCHGEQLLEA